MLLPQLHQVEAPRKKQSPRKASVKERPKKEPKLCSRCPSRLGNKCLSPKTGLCKACHRYFSRCRDGLRTLQPEAPELTVAEFIRLHPSRYSVEKKLCTRCSPPLDRVACSTKLGLCFGCETFFYFYKKKYEEEYPDAPKLTVAEFIRLSPSQYAKSESP